MKRNYYGAVIGSAGSREKCVTLKSSRERVPEVCTWTHQSLQLYWLFIAAVANYLPTGNMCLEGTVHPVFQNWTTADAEFYEELRQPLLLASKILDTDVALEWISDFIIDDIFSRDYPGAQHPHAYNCIGIQQNPTPYSIARHHKASWASPETRKFWLDRASRNMSHGIAKSVTWQLDADMFLRKGWSGYTCRHRRNSSSIPIPLDELDSYATIEAEDRACREQGLSQRHLTILLMAEYPVRLRELREKGDGSSEEYMFTAFMAAVTILHE